MRFMNCRKVIGLLVIPLPVCSLIAAEPWREIKRQDVPADFQKAMSRFGPTNDVRYFRAYASAGSSNAQWRVVMQDGERTTNCLVSATEVVANGKTNTIIRRIVGER